MLQKYVKIMEKKDRKPTLYWDDLRSGYNRIFHTCYETTEELVYEVYAKHKTIASASEILGVSRSTFWKKMKALNIPRLPKGHRGTCKSLRAVREIENISEMTSLEIAKITGFSRGRIIILMKRYGITFAKGVRREVGIWNRIKPRTPKPNL